MAFCLCRPIGLAFIRSFAQWHADKPRVISENEVLNALRDEYQKLPGNIRMLLSFEDFLQQRDKFEPAIRTQLSKSRQSKLTGGYDEHRFEKACFLRLFTSATLPFAWQDLASGYSGLCLSIRTRVEGFQAREGYPALLKPVQYGQPHETQVSQQNPLPGAFMDHEHNHSLQEWRFVRPVTKDDRGIPQLKLQRGDITRVYASTKLSDSSAEALKQLLSMDMRYKNAELWQVLPDASQWRLTAEKQALG